LWFIICHLSFVICDPVIIPQGLLCQTESRLQRIYMGNYLNGNGEIFLSISWKHIPSTNLDVITWIWEWLSVDYANQQSFIVDSQVRLNLPIQISGNLSNMKKRNNHFNGSVRLAIHF
jgi:hypothetical protein